MSKKRSIIILSLTSAICIFIASIAVFYPCDHLRASVIANAEWRTKIVVSNNGTIASNVSANFTLSTSGMIAAGILKDDATDAAITTAGGDDVAFMPGWGSNPWCVWVPNIGASSLQTYYLYTGNVTGGEYRYFPGPTGMTVPDTLTEPGTNFSIRLIETLVNTSAGANKIIFSHYDASGGIRCYGSSTVSENITAEIIDIDTPTSHIEATVHDRYSLFSGNKTMAGERFDNFSGGISSVEFKLAKVGLPTGLAYCRVRSVASNLILGTMGSIDVSTLDGTLTWKSFGTDVVIFEPTNIRVVMEYSGGDAAKYFDVGYAGNNGIANAMATFYATPDWTDEATNDMNIKLYYNPLLFTRVSAIGVPSAEYGIIEVILGER